MPVDDRERKQPVGPWSAPPRAQVNQPPTASRRAKRHVSWSAIFFVLVSLGVGIRAFKDLSRPEAWAYWKDQYLSPSLTASLVPRVDLDRTGRGRAALAIHGTIGPAAASWLRTQIEQAKLAPGDLVLLSSPGGDVGQAIIMGEIIRSHGLATAVGMPAGSDRVRPAYCASACVLVFAGGNPRYGVEGSLLGVHRFVTTTPVSDPVADTQRTTGMLLGYMNRMGVSSSVVEAMSETSAVRWLAPKEALAMNLITDPLRED